jgi:hypothetical protein
VSDQKKYEGNSSKRAAVLSVSGIISIIFGICIVTIHGPLRGSGLGTILIVLGVFMLVIAALRVFHKHSKP